jgi:hypothetical protein
VQRQRRAKPCDTVENARQCTALWNLRGAGSLLAPLLVLLLQALELFSQLMNLMLHVLLKLLHQFLYILFMLLLLLLKS